MEIVLIIFLFILGLCFGSFGSVLLTRLQDTIDKKTIKSLVFGRSQCPHCKQILSWKQLIPLISFFKQKGKCILCKKSITSLYVVLEIVSGIIFVGTYVLLAHAGWGEIIFWISINWILGLLIVYDIYRYELHLPIWILGLIIALVPQFFGQIGDYAWAFWGSLMRGGIFLGLYQGAKRYVYKRYKTKAEGLGEGDVYIAFLLGTISPFIFLYHTFSFSFINLLQLFLARIILSGVLSLLGYSIIHFIKSQKQNISFLQTKIPFIPALVVGFWLLLLFGDQILFILP